MIFSPVALAQVFEIPLWYAGLVSEHEVGLSQKWSKNILHHGSSDSNWKNVGLGRKVSCMTVLRQISKFGDDSEGVQNW